MDESRYWLILETDQVSSVFASASASSLEKQLIQKKNMKIAPRIAEIAASEIGHSLSQDESL